MTHTLLAQTLNFRDQAITQGLTTKDENAGTAITHLLTVIMVIAVLAVFIYLITAAFEWITSGGEKGKIEAARNKITGAIIGLIILSAVLAIIMILQNFLGIRVFDFGTVGPKLIYI